MPFSYRPACPSTFKEQLCAWASTFEVCCILDSNHYQDTYASYDLLVAVGVSQEVVLEQGMNVLDTLDCFIADNPTWRFGFLGYDIKNNIEQLSSPHSPKIPFPLGHFFVPTYLFSISSTDVSVVHILKHPADFSLEEFSKTVAQYPEVTAHISASYTIVPTESKSAYLSKIQMLLDHIHRGDIYEVNYCQEFVVEQVAEQPYTLFRLLKEKSPTPFSAFYTYKGLTIISASPERYMKKQGDKLISQPIKGTIKRGDTPEEEARLKQHLLSSVKERSENIMIVDMVRNDLSRLAEQGSVQVEELVGIYTFPHWHQSISTVSAKVLPTVSFVEAIKQTFPMGSMTGAPKVRAMALIDRYEASNRGCYSGSLGYISPTNEWDFNVLIRSIFYDTIQSRLIFWVGGGITAQSTPEEEYQETLLKAKAIRQLLSQ